MLQLPAFVQLEITDLCNLRCNHCYHFDTDKMPITNDLIDDKIMELVQKLVNAQIYSLVITGGEPFTRPITTIKVLEEAKRVGIFVSINTNLLLITPSIIEDLKKNRVDSLLVSCPASDCDLYNKITRCGKYEKLKSNLKLVIENDISCMVNMVVTPSNCQFIRSTASDMFDLGVKRFAATPASLNVEHPCKKDLLNREQMYSLLEDLKWCNDELGLFVDILEPMPKCFFPEWCWEKDYAFTKRSCQAGKMSMSVSNVGDVRPCSHNPLVFGNLFKEDLGDIWLKMNKCCNNFIPDFCAHCQNVINCNGGCRTNALALGKSIKGADRFAIRHMPLLNLRKNAYLEKKSLLIFNGELRWRKEFDNYSVSSKKSGYNLVIVNEEMFLFIKWLKDALPLPVESITANDSLDDESYEYSIKIINFLINRDFIKIV